MFEFVTGHPDISAPLRGEARTRHWRGCRRSRGPLPVWPGFALDDLVHRIVGEAPLAHAPLIAALRGAP